MYQKNEVSNIIPSKEVSFMDRMFMKIESICVEADKNPSLLFQEAGKYFENQVTSAGTNMRKICSELIRDLLPPAEEEELSECKHVEKCKCKCDKKKAKCQHGESTKEETKAAPGECIESSREEEKKAEVGAGECTNSSKEESSIATEVDTTSSSKTKADEDQVAQWYVNDEYKKTTGIQSTSGISKEESDSEWEML